MIDLSNSLVEMDIKNNKFIYEYCFIYGLSNPLYGTIRYVGQSISPKSRYESHLYNARAAKCSNDLKNKWLLKIQEMGFKPHMKILERCAYKDKNKFEAKWISHFLNRGEVLFNSKLPRTKRKE